MTSFQVVVLAGAMAGTGVFLILRRLLPVYPDLAQSLVMLGPQTEASAGPPPTFWEAIGQWGLNKLPAALRPIPTQDLTLLKLTPAAFLARKIAYFLAGLLLPGVVSAGLLIAGFPLPWAIPALVTLVLAVACFLVPDLEVRARAARARAEFSRTLACFIDLVALERSCGSGTKQSLDTAATVGDSWVFLRLRECLDRSTWAGQTGWDGLRELGSELGVTDLCDVADIMRLSGAEGAGIYRILRAKARSLREGLLLSDMTRANESNEKMSLPVSVLGIVFLGILIGPALLSMLGLMP